MSLEIRIFQKKKKYYLSHSYREGNQVRKVRVFLGTDLDKKALDKKIEYAGPILENKVSRLKMVNDPYKTVLAQSELEKLKSLEERGAVKISHLSEAQWLRFTEAFAYDTNAIEGSTVLKAEVKNILENRKWPEKSKEEISETIGISEAVAYIRKTKEHLSIGLIKELHRIVFRNSKEFAGSIRGRGTEVVVVNSSGDIIHRGAASDQVLILLKKLVKWYSKNRKKYTPIVLASIIHNQFEIIHPFQDGNGRIGRLLLINILLKHKLPPVNIELKNRKEYYEALIAYEEKNNLRPTIELILKEYSNLKVVLKNG